MSTAVTAIGVRRVAGSIGAEISGVRVGPDLPGPVVRQIRDALLAHKVIFFRGQDHLDDAGQAGFAQLFGELSAARRTKPGDTPESFVHEVDGDRSRATVWHTDATLTVRPGAITMLRSVLLPPYGGDTAWANTAAAYQRLGPDWQQLADGLRAVHTNNMVAAKMLGAQAAARAAGEAGQTAPAASVQQAFEEDPRQAAGLRAKHLYETEHPVVRVHPETGERSLLLGAFAKRILGRDDSDSLLSMFQAFVTPLDNTVRWRWAPGDVAMWDNRATQHCGIADFGSHKRLMHRATILGDIPVGVDGRPSIAIACPD
jgi:taurine dioxygenase